MLMNEFKSKLISFVNTPELVDADKKRLLSLINKTNMNNASEIIALKQKLRKIIFDLPDWFEKHFDDTLSSFTRKSGVSGVSDVFLGGQEYELHKQEGIDPSAVIVTNVTNVTKYIEFLDSDDILLTSLWTLGTFLWDKFDHYPYLLVNAPKASGKTKLCTILSLTSYRGVVSQNMSPSLIYRYITKTKPTLIIDDMELRGDKELRENVNGILRAGWYMGGKIMRCHPNTLEPEEFEVYCPKVISNIYGVRDDALESRCLTINLLASINPLILNSDVTPLGNEITQGVYKKNYVWAFKNAENVSEAYQTLLPVEGINGRDWQLWKPLLTIAKVIDSQENTDYFERLTILAKNKIKNRMNNDDFDIHKRILYALRSLVGPLEENYFSIDEVKDKMEYADDFDNRKIGRALRRLGFNETRKTAHGVEYFLSRKMVDDRFVRYCSKL